MRKFLHAACLLILSACNMDAAQPTYSHSATARCPAPAPISNEALVQLNTYPENSIMGLFTKAYIKQQNALDAYNRGQLEHCPPAFWVDTNVAGEFRIYGQGSPMRELFKTYVNQQRLIDAYYTVPPVAPAN